MNPPNASRPTQYHVDGGHIFLVSYFLVVCRLHLISIWFAPFFFSILFSMDFTRWNAFACIENSRLETRTCVYVVIATSLARPIWNEFNSPYNTIAMSTKTTTKKSEKKKNKFRIEKPHTYRAALGTGLPDGIHIFVWIKDVQNRKWQRKYCEKGKLQVQKEKSFNTFMHVQVHYISVDRQPAALQPHSQQRERKKEKKERVRARAEPNNSCVIVCRFYISFEQRRSFLWLFAARAHTHTAIYRRCYSLKWKFMV